MLDKRDSNKRSIVEEESMQKAGPGEEAGKVGAQ